MPKQLTDPEYIRLELSISEMALAAGRILTALAYLGMAIHRAIHPRKRKE